MTAYLCHIQLWPGRLRAGLCHQSERAGTTARGHACRGHKETPYPYAQTVANQRTASHSHTTASPSTKQGGHDQELVGGPACPIATVSQGCLAGRMAALGPSRAMPGRTDCLAVQTAQCNGHRAPCVAAMSDKSSMVCGCRIRPTRRAGCSWMCASPGRPTRCSSRRPRRCWRRTRDGPSR